MKCRVPLTTNFLSRQLFSGGGSIVETLGQCIMQYFPIEDPTNIHVCKHVEEVKSTSFLLGLRSWSLRTIGSVNTTMLPSLRVTPLTKQGQQVYEASRRGSKRA